MNTDRESIGSGLAAIPSGCAILTAEHQGRSTGVLVSWIQQASFEPPALSVCIRRGRPIEAIVAGSGKFALNILGENASAMFRHFGRGFALDDNAFAGVESKPSEFGVLLEDCIAQLGCRVVERVAAGDHDLYLGEVVAAVRREGDTPYVHLRKSGLSY